MKKIIISMLTMAAMVACSSESDPIDNIDPKGDAKVEVKLNAGINYVETKAPIVTANGFLSSDLANVFFFKSEGTPDWSTVTSAISGTIKKTDGEISFTQAQFYPTNGSNLSIIGLYLGASATSPVPSSGIITATIDGTQDIIYTPTAVTGSRVTPAATNLVFNHLLTQISFKIRKDNAVTEDIALTGVKITKVNEIDINKTVTIDLTKSSDYLSFSGSSTEGFTVTGYPTANLTDDAIPTTVTDAIMLESEISSIRVELASDAFPSKKLTAKINGLPETNNMFEKGKAYTITLTVKDKAFSGNATITDWDPKTGSADID